MNEEDLSEIMKKITSMINANNTENQNSNNSNIPSDSENNSSNNYSSEYSDTYNNSSTTRDTNNSNNSDNSGNFNIDIETILKMKTIMDKMNNTKNDPRANLLLSLKPYLKPSRKDKLDQYIKLLNMGNIIELFKPDDNSGGEGK